MEQTPAVHKGSKAALDLDAQLRLVEVERIVLGAEGAALVRRQQAVGAVRWTVNASNVSKRTHKPQATAGTYPT